MPTQVRRLYQDLSLGYNQIAPPRSLDPEGGSGFIWRDALNWIARDGELKHRLGMATYTPTAIPYQLVAGANNDQESPVQILVLPSREWIYGAGTRCTIVVTNRNIWIQPDQAASWINCTPTYAVGTVTATNGNATVTGAGGTQWQTLNIQPGGLISIDGANYFIQLVNSDTDITISPVFAGATAAGKAYTITRCFIAGGDATAGDKIFVSVQLDELYVAGDHCGGQFRPAVIKISGIFTTTPTKAYITGSTLLATGLDVVADMDRICGVKALQDGRVIVAGADSTVFYSSHLNTAVWTVSPGGQTPVPSTFSQINAMGNVGNVITLHDDSGVVLAYPTGLSDPPLRYQRSGAVVGVRHPRTLKTLGGAEYGLSANGGVIRFDLNTSTVISDPIKPTLDAGLGTATTVYHATVDRTWMEYVLAASPSALSTTVTTGWVYQIKTGLWWPWSYNAPIGAISDGPVLNPTTTKIRYLAGLYSIDGTTERAILAYLRSDHTTDNILYSSATGSTFRFTTEDLDFGIVDHYKCAHRLVLWGFRTASGTVTITVSVSRDQGANWTSLPSQNWPTTTSAESVLQFSFDPLTPGAGQSLRFRVEVVTNNFVVNFRRMLIVALDSGSIEQVEL